MRRITIILLIGLLALVLGGLSCDNGPPPNGNGNGNGNGPPPPEVQYIQVGSLHPLSGPAAPWGVLTDNCLKLAADQINYKGTIATEIYGRTTEGFVVNGQTYKWEVVSYDTQYDPTEAVSAAMRLADEGVRYVYITGGAILQACHDTTSRNGMLAFGAAALGAAGLNPDYPLTFQFETEGELAAGAFPLLMENYGVTSIVELDPDDETGYAVAEFSEFAAGRLGLDFSVEFFERDITDFYPVLTRILATNPDCICTGVSPPDTNVLITKQARELGYEGIIYAMQGIDPDLLFATAGPEYAEGLIASFTGAVDYTPAMQVAKDAYTEEFGEEAWLDFGLLFIDTLFVITQAMEEAQSLDPYVIAEYMPTMEIPHTLFDPFPRFWTGSGYYGVDHLLVNPVPLSEVVNGEFVFAGWAVIPIDVLK